MSIELENMRTENGLVAPFSDVILFLIYEIEKVAY